MKLLFISLFAGLAIVLLVKDYPGYVLINYPPWVMETALPIFILLLVVLYFAVNYLVRIVSTFLFVREKWGSWRRRRQGLRAQAAFAQGLLKTWAGRWVEAEKLLTRSATNSAYPALHLLAAAHAAQQQGGFSRRDRYLNAAKLHVKDQDQLVVDIIRAELQMESGELDSAEKQLRGLYERAPKNLRIMRSLAQVYHKKQDWEHLTGLMKTLRDQKIVNRSEFQALEVEAHRSFLQQMLDADEPLAVANAWIGVPLKLREHERILPLYVRSLIAQGEGNKAEQLLYSAIKHNWQDIFIELYGLTRSNNLNKQLHRLETWLQGKPRHTVLLQAAARICLVSKLWGKARSYLEAAVAIRPSQEMYKELGDLLEMMGETQAAVNCYRRGLALAVGETVNVNGRGVPEREVQLMGGKARESLPDSLDDKRLLASQSED